jgi:hypothetical protein
MRFTITADHREFFHKNLFIELEEILPSDQVIALKENAEKTIAGRLHIPKAKLSFQPSKAIFQAGYDLWRDNEAIKKITHKQALASLASELFQVTPIRYGFDQYFLMTQDATSPISMPCSLAQISCLSPLAGALILTLENLATPISDFPFPQKAGHGLYISPSLPLPWPHLFSQKGLSFLLIAFAENKTFFHPNPQDPHASALKKLGYAFNDLLSDSLHPIILREH